MMEPSGGAPPAGSGRSVAGMSQPRTLLPPSEWYASLPAVLASASVLITDPAGAVLAVKPNYQPSWNVPGGILEADESPHLLHAGTR